VTLTFLLFPISVFTQGLAESLPAFQQSYQLAEMTAARAQHPTAARPLMIDLGFRLSPIAVDLSRDTANERRAGYHCR
jgi:hypothetical protein